MFISNTHIQTCHEFHTRNNTMRLRVLRMSLVGSAISSILHITRLHVLGSVGMSTWCMHVDHIGHDSFELCIAKTLCVDDTFTSTNVEQLCFLLHRLSIATTIQDSWSTKLLSQWIRFKPPITRRSFMRELLKFGSQRSPTNDI